MTPNYWRLENIIRPLINTKNDAYQKELTQKCLEVGIPIEWKDKYHPTQKYLYNDGDFNKLQHTYKLLLDGNYDGTIICMLDTNEDGTPFLYYTPKDKNWKDFIIGAGIF